MNFLANRSTVLREIPFSALQFSLYEAGKRAYLAHVDSHVPSHVVSVLGAVSGGLAAAVTTPLDVVKTRLMTQPTRTVPGLGAGLGAGPGSGLGAEPYRGVVSTLMRIHRDEGLAGLFSGLHGSSRVHLSSAVSLWMVVAVVTVCGGWPCVAVDISGVRPRVAWISLGGAVFFGVYEAARNALG